MLVSTVVSPSTDRQPFNSNRRSFPSPADRSFNRRSSPSTVAHLPFNNCDSGIILSRDGLVSSVEHSKLLRLTQGNHIASQVVSEASENNEKFRLFVNSMASLLEEFALLDASNALAITSNVVIDGEIGSAQGRNETPKVILQDTNISQTKGRTA